MEDFSALAARVAASVVELRGCLILSRDGLVLGAYPAGEEGLVKPAWLRFAVVGEPEKGFIEFGSEIWTYVRRGPYAAFAVSELGVRPGLVIDQLEQMLLSAEEVRAKREALRVPEVPAAPSGKPRTSLHPDPRPPFTAPPPVPAPARAQPSQPLPPPGPARPAEPAASAPAPSHHGSPTTSPRLSDPQPPVGRPSPPPQRPAPGPRRDDDETETEVDRVALAQEFSRLLQESGGRDENN
jgi:hypothetical protein